jgi:SAM-dependent methyltransferase
MRDATGQFYDRLAPTYHRIYPDWAASVARQGDALHRLITDRLGPGPHRILDAACGIGTQALGLAAHGHTVIGSDLSPVALARATAEAVPRGVSLPVAAGDLRSLPFRCGAFDVVVCADNALPHLTTPQEVLLAANQVRRLLRPGGLLIASTRDYDEVLATRPTATTPQDTGAGPDRVITFQLWHWHPDGRHYDLEHFQVIAAGAGWTTRMRRTTYWALTRDELADLVRRGGFGQVEWLFPERTGFFQQLLVASPN